MNNHAGEWFMLGWLACGYIGSFITFRLYASTVHNPIYKEKDLYRAALYPMMGPIIFFLLMLDIVLNHLFEVRT